MRWPWSKRDPKDDLVSLLMTRSSATAYVFVSPSTAALPSAV